MSEGKTTAHAAAAWAPLGRLCEALQTQLDHAAHANVYITPGNAGGFTPHYDTHEVLVLQIAGHKRWSLYDPPLDLPHRSQPFNPAAYTATAPVRQVDLNAGGRERLLSDRRSAGADERRCKVGVEPIFVQHRLLGDRRLTQPAARCTNHTSASAAMAVDPQGTTPR
jgi:hypothetical protein